MTSPNPGLLAALLKTGRLTGVMRWKVNLSQSAAQGEAQIAKWTCHYTDSAGAKTLDDTLAIFAKDLNLGEISLANFTEKLTELFRGKESAEGNNNLLVWTGWQDLVNADDSAAKIISGCLEEVVSNTSDLVLVVDSQGKFPEIDQLTSI